MKFIHEELSDYISDLHKAMYGILPNQYIWSDLTVTQLEAIADELDEKANAMYVDSGLDDGQTGEA